MPALLLVSVFVIATCGLVYELIAGTLASYLLGDSVTQFSTVIGVYLSAMGVGSWLSGRLERDLLALFIRTEILIGLVGGFSAAALFLLFDQVTSFRIPLYGIVGVIGVLVGVEIPLLLRILQARFAFKDLVARVFTFDYIGALFASLLFPLILVPHLGLIRSGLLFGMLNVAVALWLLFSLGDEVRWVRGHRVAGIAALVALLVGFVYADRIMAISEAAVYADPVIYAQSTPYQRIVLTASRRDLRLFLNGNLQFSSRDEYRYHEALVHPGLAAVNTPNRVLIFGGGDGLAAREVLKVDAVQSITQVELDPAMVRLFSANTMLSSLNNAAFASPKLHVITADAFVWLKQQSDAGSAEKFDYIIVDFPDPSNYAIGKLYSLTFFRLLRQRLAPGGAIVVQSTSPYVARQSFWCVAATLEAAGFRTLPYHAYVPSFGEWGFVLASQAPLTLHDRYPAGLRYVNATTAADMQHFPPDMDRVPTEINRLDSQALVRYFDTEWAEYGVN
ncbi:polyamine aminopropyltransferase [Acidisphaera sp. L21]|uniref:polyamine aminopropyltransferase n=1 Tax=Acidisphaera sp. L21 TaxID=1641851 RepID=UPI001C209106|nr:polyamine aminopropyltransferase [Acidisphaera sp. L21]